MESHSLNKDSPNKKLPEQCKAEIESNRGGGGIPSDIVLGDC